MSTFSTLFKHHEDKVWQQLCDGIGGDFINKEGWRNDKIVCEVDNWTITLDLYAEPGYKTEYLYTRLRAFFKNPLHFHFTLHHKSLIDRIATLFGSQNIRINDSAFNKLFVLKANNIVLAQTLFSNERVLPKVKEEKDIYIHMGLARDLMDHEDVPEGKDELILMVEGEVNDVARLKEIYILFSNILHELYHLENDS